MAQSIYDLVFNFIEKYATAPVTQEYKKGIFRAYKQLLRKGFTDREIEECLNRGQDLMDILDGRNPKSQNLLSPDGFYYHNQLRITPGVPKVKFDLDTGTVERIPEEYFLEMRASYTVDDLYRYYLGEMGIEENPHGKNRLIGAFNWLLKQYDIDTLLFMIDTAASNKLEDSESGYIEPLDMVNYHQEAVGALTLKRTEEKLAGDDIVLPRKRVLSG